MCVHVNESRNPADRKLAVAQTAGTWQGQGVGACAATPAGQLAAHATTELRCAAAHTQCGHAASLWACMACRYARHARLAGMPGMHGLQVCPACTACRYAQHALLADMPGMQLYCGQATPLCLGQAHSRSHLGGSITKPACACVLLPLPQTT